MNIMKKIMNIMKKTKRERERESNHPRRRTDTETADDPEARACFPPPHPTPHATPPSAHRSRVFADSTGCHTPSQVSSRLIRDFLEDTASPARRYTQHTRPSQLGVTLRILLSGASVV